MSSGLPLDAKIYVAGHRGLAGSALMRALHAGGHTHLIQRTHAELDLTNQAAARDFFQKERPEYVFMAAAKVGGIVANDTYPAEFLAENVAIQTNVIHEAWRAGAKRLLFLGSSCIYPRDCPQPIRESYLLTGPLEATNRPYALAKIAGVEMCWAYNRQYGTRFLAAMPTNLYGPGDNYDLQNSHVLPALIRKFHEAKVRGDQTVTLWGTGAPRREFLYSDDMAAACVFLMSLDDEAFDKVLNEEAPFVLSGTKVESKDNGTPPLINIGCGEDLTIRELAEKVREIVGFTGRIAWDSSKPDGTPRKLLDVSRLFSFDWRPRIGLAQGIVDAYRDFLGTNRR
jgi:GDP-L-fucose synthase